MLVAPFTALQNEGRWYVIKPAHELPVIDINRSMREYFPSAIIPFIRRVARTKWPLIAYLICALFYIPALFITGDIGLYIAVAVVIVTLPAPIIAFSVLRYDMVQLLIKTFDIRLITLIAIMTHSLFFMVVKSAGGFMLGCSFIYSEILAFTDANPFTARSLQLVDAMLAILGLSFSLLLLFDRVPHVYDFNLVSYRSRYLPAISLIRFGHLTTCTVLLRNAYRKYQRLGTDTHNNVCVSYRCQLQFISVMDRVASSRIQSIRHESKRQMRYIPIVPTVDATHTVNPHLFRRKNDPVLWTMTWYSWPHKLRLIAALFSMGIGTVDFVQYVYCPHCVSATGTSHCRLIGLFLTAAYVGCCVMVQQRQLLVAIFTSFDFGFLAVQIVFVNGAIVAFYTGESSVIVRSLTSLLWCYWVLTVDAITPIMRLRVGIDNSSLRIVCTSLVVLELVVIYLLIFDPLADELNDLVLWSSNIFGEVCLLSTFYGMFTTVFAWSLRILSRVWNSNWNDLIMLDGPVQYYGINNKRKGRINIKERVQSGPHKRVLSGDKPKVFNNADGLCCETSKGTIFPESDSTCVLHHSKCHVIPQRA